MNYAFCAIAEGQQPAHIIHRDEHFLALLEFFPLRLPRLRAALAEI